MPSGDTRQRGEGRAVGPSFAIVGLAVLGVAVTVLTIGRSIAEANARDERAASLAAAQLSADLTSTLASLAGADAMAADGRVDSLEFDSFAAGVMFDSRFVALAYSDIVSSGERAGWEQSTGIAILDITAAGTSAPAVERPTHAPIHHVAPKNEQTSRIVGIDLFSDATRSLGLQRALNEQGSVVAGPINLATDGQRGLFATSAVRTPDGRPIGLLSSGIAADLLLQQLDDFPHLGSVSMAINGEDLIAEGEVGGSASFSIDGQLFTVSADDDRGPGRLQPTMVGVATLLACLAAFVSVGRERKYRGRQRWLIQRNRRLASLAERLGGALTVEAMLRVVTEQAAGVIGADTARMGRRDARTPATLLVRRQPPPGIPGADITEYELDAHVPIAECARLAEMVVVPDRLTLETNYPEAARDPRHADVAALLCAPLTLGDDGLIGAIEFAWQRPFRGERSDLLATAELETQMIGRAFERIQVRELVQQRVERLNDFARALNISRTTSDVAASVARLLPPLLGVASATLVNAPSPANGDRLRSYPPQSPDGDHLELQLYEDFPWTPTSEALTAAALQLIESGWSRAKLYDHEHSVLLRLQSSLLVEPPVVPGLHLTVAYRSAVEAVGIGGDWYSIVDQGDSLYAVIGDVAGHGPEAVALMAEVKTVIRHLLSAGVDAAFVMHNAHASLVRRSAYASAVIACINKRAGTLSYVNAGHPYPLLLDRSGVTRLEDRHRPWLGVDAEADPATTVEFPRGSTLLLYTDGLVEERGTSIDRSIDALGEIACSFQGDTDELVDRLLRHRFATRTARTVDDDIAVIAIRNESL